MNVITKTLSGAEISVAIGGQNTEIRNDGAATVYASANAGVVAGADGVVAIPAGAAVTVLDTRGTVYLSGTGEVSVVGKDTVAPVFKCAPSTGGSGKDDVARQAIAAHSGNAEIHVTADEKAAWNAVNYSNPNLLINPDFRVNQRGASGTISAAGYFVDRWQLADGTVTVNADGTITLDGTITQTLEFAVGDDVTPSADAGTATYDDTTRTFTLTASGEVIKWAKLEVGSVATPFSPPEFGSELVKCQRYYCRIATSNRAWAHYGTAFATSDSVAFIVLQLPTTMRPNRVVTWGGNHRLYKPSGSFTAAVTAITVAGRKFDTDATIALYINADGLTADENYIFSVQNDSTAFLEVDAEIY